MLISWWSRRELRRKAIEHRVRMTVANAASRDRAHLLETAAIDAGEPYILRKPKPPLYDFEAER